MKNLTKTLLAVGALAAVAGTASAGRIDGGERGVIVPINWDIAHNFGSTSFVKSLLITVLEPFSGEVNPLVTILGTPAPVVTVNTVGGAPRAVDNVEILNLSGGGMAVRWTFPDSNLWSQGETLVFSFTTDFTSGGTDYLIGEDYTFIPTPGAAALMAGAGLVGVSRRRR